MGGEMQRTLSFTIFSREQRSKPANLKQLRPSSVIQLKTLRTVEAVICHQKLKNIHSQAQTPHLSNVVFCTVRYNSSFHLLTTHIRSTVEHHSLCIMISINRRFIGLYTDCLDGLRLEKTPTLSQE